MPSPSVQTVRVFISSVSSEFGHCRLEISGLLVEQKILPIVQDYFRPDDRRVLELLEDSIRSCDAVIALVGFRLGFATFVPAGPRKSYTQLEYEIARKLDKPVFLFLSDAQFTPQQLAEQAPEDARLQAEYRDALMGQSFRYEMFSSLEQLTKRVSSAIPRILELGAGQSLPPLAIDFPKAPAAFVGRELELDQLTSALQQPSPAVTAVLGVAGQGKSTLVAHWFQGQHAQAGFRARSWCTFSASVTVDRFLEETLNYLLEGKYTQLPSREQAFQKLLNLLNARPTLLVLDGLEQWLGHASAEAAPEAREPAAAVEKFLEQATSLNSGSHVVIVSRVFPAVLEGAKVSIVPVYPEDKRMQLEGLTVEAAIELLTQLGVKGTREQLLGVAETYSRHPLALGVAAQIVAKRGWSFLSSSANEPKQRVFELFAEALRQAGVSAQGKQILEFAALAFESLPVQALQHGLEQGNNSWTGRLAGWFSHRAPVDVVGTVLSLAEWHLIDWDPDRQRVRMHALLKEFFASGCGHANRVHLILAQWYLAQPIADSITTLLEAQPRMMALEHALACADGELAQSIFFGPLTHRHTLADWMTQFGHLVRELPARVSSLATGPARANCLMVRAMMSRQLGLLPDALTDLNEAIRLLQTASGQQPSLPGALMNRGNVHRQMCRYDDALADYASSLEMIARLADRSRQSIVLLLMNRAALLHDIGYAERAASDAGDAVKLLEAGKMNAGGPDPQELPSALVVLANIQSDMGRNAEALVNYDRAEGLLKQWIAAGEAEWEPRLARLNIVRPLCLLAAGHTDRALADLQAAIVFLEARIRESHSEFESDLAMAYLNLADVERSAALLSEASETIHKTVSFYRMLTSSGRQDLEGYLANALLQAARVAGERSQWPECFAHVDEALELSRQVLARGQTDLLGPIFSHAGPLVRLLAPVDAGRAVNFTSEVLKKAHAGLQLLPKSELMCAKAAQFLAAVDQAGGPVLAADPQLLAWLRENCVI